MRLHYVLQTMLGAFIYYMASGFANNYNEYYCKRYEKRNFWTGYLAILMLVFIFILLVIFL